MNPPASLARVAQVEDLRGVKTPPTGHPLASPARVAQVVACGEALESLARAAQAVADGVALESQERVDPAVDGVALESQERVDPAVDGEATMVVTTTGDHPLESPERVAQVEDLDGYG